LPVQQSANQQTAQGLHKAERGFALITALVVAILFFGFLELLLLESSEAFRAASRFRARTIAQTLAENAAELAVRNMLAGGASEADLAVPGGSMKATYVLLPGGGFRVDAFGMSSGVMPSTASVIVIGHFNGSAIQVTGTIHSQ
jgi:hypothetical protein